MFIKFHKIYEKRVTIFILKTNSREKQSKALKKWVYKENMGRGELLIMEKAQELLKFQSFSNARFKMRNHLIS